MDLKKKALTLSYFTVIYNIIEGIVSIIAGILASGSIALIGFGLDSFIESLSGGVMIWRFGKHKLSEEEEEKIEKRATKFVAVTFFILAVYVLYESIRKLYLHEKPESSLFGIIIAIVSMIVMPVLFYAKFKTGKALNSNSLIADSKETLACVFLSVALLIGLGFNYIFKFWPADPIVGFVIVIFLVKEGIENTKGDEE